MLSRKLTEQWKHLQKVRHNPEDYLQMFRLTEYAQNGCSMSSACTNSFHQWYVTYEPIQSNSVSHLTNADIIDNHADLFLSIPV